MDLEQFAHYHSLSPIPTHRLAPTYARTRGPFTLTITATGDRTACLTVHGLGAHRSAHVTEGDDLTAPDDPYIAAMGATSTNRDAALLATFNRLEHLCLADAASAIIPPTTRRPRLRDSWWQP